MTHSNKTWVRVRSGGFGGSSDSWQMKVQSALAVFPFPFAWVIIAGCVAAPGVFVTLAFEDEKRAFAYIAIECVLFAAMANSVVYIEMLMDQFADAARDFVDNDQEQTDLWLNEWYTNMFWSCRNILMGLGMGAATVGVSTRSVPEIYGSVPGSVYGYLMAFTLGFIAGSLLWVVLSVAAMFSDIGGSLRIRASIFDSKCCALRVVSSILLKISLIVVMIYLLGILIYYVCDIVPGKADLVIIVGFGVFVMGYFIAPQVNVHRTLLNMKRERTGAIVRQIDIAFDDVASDPTEENLAKLRDLFSLQKVVNGKNTWSFGTQEVLFLASSVLVPLILFLLQYFLGIEQEP